MTIGGTFMRGKSRLHFLSAVAAAGVLMLASGLPTLFAQAPVPVPAPVEVPALSANQLDGMVAPIALYPDPLLGQVLTASTYPLELVEANQWLQRNPGLSGPALTQAASGQNWDPS